MSTKQGDYKELWNNRYRACDFAYGKEPNLFFKDQLDQLKPGKILLPAEGEGRNAVYAATKDWGVSAIDFSEEGRQKALSLAKEFNVTINYSVEDIEQLESKEDSFDAIGLVYAHFIAEKKSTIHGKLHACLKKGGIIIFEAFSKNNLPLVKANPNVGGGMDINMLFSIEELKTDFSAYQILLLEEREIELNEGLYHNGIGSVIRFVGRKL